MRLRRLKLLIHSRRVPLGGLSAATVLTIAGIATNGATSKVLLAGGVASGAVGAAAALQRANSLEREIKRQQQVAEDVKVIKNKALDVEPLDYRQITEQILSEVSIQITRSTIDVTGQLQNLEKAQEELLRKAREETYSKTKEADHLARIAELEQRLADASTSNADDNATASQANGTSPAAETIEDYNQEDRVRTVDLRHQQSLSEQPLQLEAEAKRKAREPYPLELLEQRLLEELPDPLEDPGGIGGRGLSWRAQQLLAQLLPFHHREWEVEWCAYLGRRDKSPSELFDDSEAIAKATWQSKTWSSGRARAYVHHFRFDPNQPLKLQVGTGVGALTLELPDTGLKLAVAALDAAQGTVSLKLPWSKRDQRIPKETSLIKVPVDISKSLRERLQEQAEGWLERNQQLPAAMVQLLERQPLPKLRALNSELAKDPGQVSGRLAGFLARHSGITLALQGPPGSGKTTVASQVIAQLVKQGKRVAISSHSHAAINNLLKKAKTTCDGVAGYTGG